MMLERNEPPAPLFFSADRKDPGSVDKDRTFCDVQHANNNGNHLLVPEGE